MTKVKLVVLSIPPRQCAVYVHIDFILLFCFLEILAYFNVIN